MMDNRCLILLLQASAALRPEDEEGPCLEIGRTDLMDYLFVLQQLHVMLNPDVYLEIGVQSGASMAFSRSKTIGIDPAPAVSSQGAGNKPWVKIYRETSD